MSTYVPLRPDPQNLNDAIYWIQGELDQIANAITELNVALATAHYVEMYYDDPASVDDDINATLTNWLASKAQTGLAEDDLVAGTLTLSSPGTYEVHASIFAEIGTNSDSVLELFTGAGSVPGAKSGGQTKQADHVSMTITALAVVDVVPTVLHLENVTTVGKSFIVKSGSFWARKVYP